MPRISRIEPMRVPKQQTLVIATMTSIKTLNQTMDDGFKLIADYLEEVGKLKAGVGFVAYHNFDFDNMDIEVGFPVVNSPGGRGKITTGEIPEQDMLFCLYQGPYHKIGSTYEQMDQWIKEHNYQKEELVYEYYYNDGEKDRLVTKILMPLIKALDKES